MALKIRQGIEADRTSFVPETGELIYTTDEKLVYVGDGITPGGNIISSGGAGTTYTISAETNLLGADLRLTGSDASTDNVSFVGSGIVTVSRTDSNTITISATGGSGSGTVDSGNAGELAFYSDSGTTVVGSGNALTFNQLTATLNIPNINNIETIITSDPNFRIINTNNNEIIFGGINDNVEYSGNITILDVGPYKPTAPGLSIIRQVHNDTNVNCLIFQRERGTLVAPDSIQQGDVVGALLWTAATDDQNTIAQVGTVSMLVVDPFTPGSLTLPGTFAVQTSNDISGLQLAFYITSTQDTHSVYYHYARLGIFTPQIDTEDSSALTIVPQAVFESDVEVQNDLYVTNKVFANEFVSSSTATPEIVTTQDLNVVADLNTFTFRTDGGLTLPVLSSAPLSPAAGTVYIADKDNWDPLTSSGTGPYLVLWSGTGWVSVNGA